MKHPRFSKFIYFVGFSLFTISPAAHAGFTEVTLGNGTSGWLDGDIVDSIDVSSIQAGQPTPFSGTIGDDADNDPGGVNWLFNYAAITDTIVHATFSFGIWDHDTAASGSQLELFSLDGTNLTTELDTLFESGGGTSDREYTTYTLTLGNSFFADLADGFFSADLDIGGSGLSQSFSTGLVTETGFNGYSLISSTLSITTENAPDPDPDPAPDPDSVPEPATLGLLGIGLAGLGWKRRKTLIRPTSKKNA